MELWQNLRVAAVPPSSTGARSEPSPRQEEHSAAPAPAHPPRTDTGGTPCPRGVQAVAGDAPYMSCTSILPPSPWVQPAPVPSSCTAGGIDLPRHPPPFHFHHNRLNTWRQLYQILDWYRPICLLEYWQLVLAQRIYRCTPNTSHCNTAHC